LRISIPLFLALSACSQTSYSGAAFDLALTADGQLGPAIRELVITVGGSDSDSFSVPASDLLRNGGTQHVDYRATAGSGPITFDVRGTGVASLLIASGSASANIAGTQTLTIALMAPSPDMATFSADMAPEPPITPSHVSAVAFQPAAASLSGVIRIDTDNLLLDILGPTDAGLAAPPPGIAFVHDSGFAVLSVGAWNVDRELTVFGSLPLVVVAAGPVVIGDVIHCEARGTTQGPGGDATGTAGGVGGDGMIAGGGGGGHATSGGNGGTASFLTGTPGTGGVAYGTTLADLLGGAHGGAMMGMIVGTTCNTPGGAGGGAIQISTASSIDVSFRGAINAGGGGGGICTPILGAYGGAGGGSGGTIFLEGRAVRIHGVIAANGGAGGGSSPGDDGQLSPAQATTTGGGSGGALNGMPTNGGSNSLGAGGGGGAAGSIWLRTPAGVMPDLTNGVVSPAPQLDTTLQ
jgi:hypothetical protein